jgi:3-deoxy-D-manno-octulosonic-acid transferase
MTANADKFRAVQPTSARWRRRAAMVVYQFVFLFALILYSPVLLWRVVFDRRHRHGLRERMGYVNVRRTKDAVVWVHGVSVGEVKAAKGIITKLQEDRPDLQIVLSATTPNGLHVARLEHEDLEVIYYPLDFGLFPRRALRRVRPRCVLLMELEIWPNFLQAARRRSIPVAVINGRISERTYDGYRRARARGLLPQLDLISMFCVQDDAYRQRLLDLGVDDDCVSVTGNMKYDSVVMGGDPAGGAALRRWLADEGQLVVVGGSTHGTEERWLCDALTEAGLGADGCRLVVVPRHPERAAAVRDSIRAAGRESVFWSELDDGRVPLPEGVVLVVDTIGQLQRFYAACDIAFVGGSLVKHGGQNMLEPAALGRAVVYGPHTFNFRADVELLSLARAAVQVGSVVELSRAFRALAGDPAERERLGTAARGVIEANRGATGRTFERIQELLDSPT